MTDLKNEWTKLDNDKVPREVSNKNKKFCEGSILWHIYASGASYKNTILRDKGDKSALY